MKEREFTEKAKQVAVEHGADLVGVVRVEDLPEHSEQIEKMIPEARSILVIAYPHLSSGGNHSPREHTYITACPPHIINYRTFKAS